MKCLNCETQFKGQFCPNCGQKSNVRRLTVFTVLKDFIDALTDSDRGFLKTVIDLSKNPGVMLNDYIYGRRQRYLSAAKYSLSLIILFTLHFSYLEHHYGWFEKLASQVDRFTYSSESDEISIGNPTVNNGENIDGDSSAEEKNEEDSSTAFTIKSQDNEESLLKFSLFGIDVDKKVTSQQYLEFAKFLIPKYHKTLFDYLKIFILLWIPIFSFFSYFFFFSSPFNLAEHVTLNSYIYAHVLLIFLLLSPFYWLAPELSVTTIIASSGASLFYLIYSYMQVFSKRSQRLVKTLLSLSASFFTYILFLTILTATLASWIALQNIEHL